MRRRHGHHSGHGGPPWRGQRWGRPPPGWLLVRGVHRRVLGFLVLAALLGAVGGGALTAARAGGEARWWVGAVLALLALWPLGWMASFRIAWPLRELAQVAADLRAGRAAPASPAGPAEVDEVGAALRELAAKVQRQLDDQRALMATVSHELRSPLGHARVLAELVREGHDPVPLADQLQAEIDAMDQLVGDLLAVARIDFEALDPRPLAPADLARRALELEGEDEGLLSLGPTLPDLRGDPTLLARAVRGLLANARLHGGGAVELRVEARGPGVRFTVCDGGPGFAAGEEESAFAPFWRGAAAEDGQPGTGLGLALVRRIAEAHGGRAGAANRPGGGAEAWVELPAG